MASITTTSKGNTYIRKKPSSSSDNEITRRERKRSSVTNGFISSLRTTEREQKLNESKLRIRHLPENPDEDTTRDVIEALNSSLGTNLTTSDIISCQRVVCWNGVVQPRDIVVTFADVIRRHCVYGRKFQYVELPFQIIEELCEERARIWSEAVVVFGEKNIVILRGVIYILTRRKHMHQIRTMWQFKTFLKKLSNELLVSPFDMAGISDENIYESDTSEELSFTFYEPNRKNRELEKKIRIRNIPEVPNENTKLEAFQYISSNMTLGLEISDIEFCERVVGWDGCVKPRDIAVTFKYKHLQQRVLFYRRFIRKGRTIILEDLTPEMAEVWGEAVKTFGEDKVHIIANNISINVDGVNHPVTSMMHYRSFVTQSNY